MTNALMVPLIAGGYLLVFIVAMAAFGIATGRDFGFGDGFTVPLANGYRYEAIDIPDSGFVTNLSDINIGADDRDSFADVLQLQEQGDWLAGSFIGTRPNFPDATTKPDHWFFFNTKTRARFDCADEDKLRVVAAEHGVHLNLQQSGQFYASHRYQWYDGAVAIMLWIPATLWIRRTLKRVRRMRRASAKASFARN